MSFPTTIDVFGTKNTGDVIQAVDVNGLQTAVVALENKVGTDSSAIATSLDYLVKNTASIDPGHKHTTASISSFNITSPAAGDLLQYDTATSKWLNKAIGTVQIKFGGTGSNGAFVANTSSGAVNIDLGNAAVVVKNYTSISITQTGSMTFTNPNSAGTVIVLKSQGDVTLTSTTAPMIAAQGMGAAGAVSSTGGLDGTPGTDGVLGIFKANGGSGGTAGGGTKGAAISLSYPTTAVLNQIIAAYPQGFIGSGGGSGKSGGGNSGVGGAGGPMLIIECGGALNFTTANGISVKGANGLNAASGGGGGGGGGGYCGIFYNTLTANSGTILISATTGGTGTSQGGGGGGGGLGVGVDGTVSAGGAGGVGISVVALNTQYA